MVVLNPNVVTVLTPQWVMPLIWFMLTNVLETLLWKQNGQKKRNAKGCEKGFVVRTLKKI